MPVTDRSTGPTRGLKTICIPCSQDGLIATAPELFPTEIGRVDRMKDASTSRKTGWKIRRIDLRNEESYSVRPLFLTPYRSGRTEDVQAPFFSASSPSRSGR